MIDRNGLVDEIKMTGKMIDVELGCGENKKHADAIGVDVLDLPGVDLVGDVYEVLNNLPDNCVNHVWSYHFLEHVDNVSLILNELARVCASNASVDFVVPHFSNPFFYSDPTHQKTFGLYTFSYYCVDEIFTRTVPKYGYDPKFKITSVRLVFKSYRPNYVRHAFKKIVESIVNVSAWFMELYEEQFCYFAPCYEIHYSLELAPDSKALIEE